ncbi:DnaJ C-terminal domain-containing protein [Shewanella sp.]|uniref:DnaJ C-terminal domain-containing protein n=1 Tax=Shewanella sp. TaxID=50422 RepID=UPI003A96DBBB
MAFKDYYQIMGVARDATEQEIKKAYKRLARKYHPDVNKAADAEARFKELGEAYDVLRDPKKRAAYDQFGADWQTARHAQADGFAGQQYEQAGPDMHHFEDIFSSFFGGQGFGAGRSSRRGFESFDLHGDNVRAKIQIDLADSYHGATRTLTITDAQGQPKTLNVRIPKGVVAGQYIRLAGQGAAGLGNGKAGDLLLEVAFKPHSLYRVEGKDVYLSLPVAPWEAALGAQVSVPLPTGNIDLKIPANSANGRRLRLAGKGLPAKQPGDFYVELNVVLPPATSAKAKQAYEAFKAATDFLPRAGWGQSR